MKAIHKILAILAMSAGSIGIGYSGFVLIKIQEQDVLAAIGLCIVSCSALYIGAWYLLGEE